MEGDLKADKKLLSEFETMDWVEEEVGVWEEPRAGLDEVLRARTEMMGILAVER